MNAKQLHCIVEVSVDGAHGRLALGIMNMQQALDLPYMPTVSYSHPDPAKAANGVTLNRQELAGFVARH